MNVWRVGPFVAVLVEHDDLLLAERLRRHHRGLGAGDELARVRCVLGPERDADRDADPTGSFVLGLGDPG